MTRAAGAVRAPEPTPASSCAWKLGPGEVRVVVYVEGYAGGERLCIVRERTGPAREASGLALLVATGAAERWVERGGES